MTKEDRPCTAISDIQSGWERLYMKSLSLIKRLPLNHSFPPFIKGMRGGIFDRYL
jgi:hypothetical protein